MSSARDHLLSLLLVDSHVMPLERVAARVAEHAEEVGFIGVRIYLADVQERVLRLLSGPGLTRGRDREETELQVEGTVPGRAFQYGEVVRTEKSAQDGTLWWIPLLDGTERLGVVRARTASDDTDTLAGLKALAALVALLVVSKRHYSDAHARLVRSTKMNVPAEMQWTLMPPRTYADDRVVLGAVMEPAYQVSGDAFDYATSGEVVHLAVYDAMGHDVAAGLTANLAMATARSQRRAGRTLQEVAEEVGRMLVTQFDGDRFVTAVLADLDTRTGQLTWANYGHYPPVIIRGGRSTPQLECRPGPPLGTDFSFHGDLCQESLEPGDRVVFYTDGITEARSPAGQEFGLARFLDFLIRQHADGLPVPETLRRLMMRILQHHDDQLDDDATVLLAEWNGPGAFRADEVEARTGLPPSEDDQLKH
ncbi:serine/threonine-protein phosphatase [Streptomyces bathyalis]|uniref:Serine/threonine-protein phosphatase n=1 Tax=Streptomyces bathyalis TaxID=2710756 RepID=A0A7T1WQW2_9ACTN|nr:PP2C family protein-serine/threonine phosphatase [Streptomyces bathyalis]QPP07343.1 serine/threonine-protein phosphatase [Streptomyces bathyalis]